MPKNAEFCLRERSLFISWGGGGWLEDFFLCVLGGGGGHELKLGPVWCQNIIS